MKKNLLSLIIFALFIFIAVGSAESDSNSNSEQVQKELTRADESKLQEALDNSDNSALYTSLNLTKADIAWHAVNTYGWNCEEVINIGEAVKITKKTSVEKRNFSDLKGVYYPLTCSNGKKLRFYPRFNMHPIITNANGSYAGVGS